MDEAKSAKDFSENLLNQGCKRKGMEVGQNRQMQGKWGKEALWGTADANFEKLLIPMLLLFWTYQQEDFLDSLPVSREITTKYVLLMVYTGSLKSIAWKYMALRAIKMEQIKY